MQLKFKSVLREPHLHIHIFCTQHWFKKEDENSYNKHICEYHKHDSTQS